MTDEYVARGVGASIFTEADDRRLQRHSRVGEPRAAYSTRGGEHHVTIPDHTDLRLGTLASMLDNVATHLGVDGATLASALFTK